MTSQETVNSVEYIIKHILTKWDTVPFNMRSIIRNDLMSVFVSFVGENNKTLNDEQVIGIHLC